MGNECDGCNDLISSLYDEVNDLVDENDVLRQLCLASAHLLRGASAIYDPHGDLGPTNWLETRNRLLMKLDEAVAE
jgi:hypothetical protein